MRTSDGLLLVDKPAGITSHDAVVVVRRAVAVRRIGHAGTLDPFATGLLVLLVGRATRLLSFLEGEPKVYAATVRFGHETDTDDCTGAATRTAPPPPRGTVERALASLTGALMQVPPAYSAKRRGGRRAYDAARRGEAMALDPVPVHVHEWIAHGWEGGDFQATIVCSGGTYVRSLARDLGRATGSAAHLAALRRVRSGPFDVADAQLLDEVRAGRARVRPMLEAVPSLPREPLDASSLACVRHGAAVPATVPGERAALVDALGALAAIGERAGAEWRPRVVLADA